MQKNQLAATSLVAAIPAGVLAVLLIMAFLGSTDKMTGVLIGVNAVALLLAILVALMPAAVMVFYGRERSEKPKEDAGASAAAGAAPVATGTTGAVTAEILTEDAEEAVEEDVGFDDEAVATETDAFEFNADEMEDVESADEAFEFEDEDEQK